MNFNKYHMELGKYELIAGEKGLDVNITRMANAFYHQLDLKYGKIEPSIQKENYKRELSDRYESIVGKVKETIDCKLEMDDILNNGHLRIERRAKGINRLRKICEDIDSVYTRVDEMSFAYLKRILFRRYYNNFIENLEQHQKANPKYILEGANCAYKKLIENNKEVDNYEKNER